MFSCMEVDGKMRLKSMLAINCESEVHKKYTNIIFLPSMIIWGVVLPLVIFYEMCSNKDNLEDAEV